MFTKSKDTDENNLNCLFKELLRVNNELNKFLKNEIHYSPQSLRLVRDIENYPLNSRDPEAIELYENLIWFLNNLEKTWKKWQFDISSVSDNKRKLTHYCIENLFNTSTINRVKRINMLYEIQKQKQSELKIGKKEPQESFIKRIHSKYFSLADSSSRKIIYFYNPSSGTFDLTYEKRKYPC